MAASNDGASTAVVLTVGIVFAIVGFNVQHVSSAGRSLDAQVRSAPLSRLGLFMGTVGIPFAICCLVVSILSLALFVPYLRGRGPLSHRSTSRSSKPRFSTRRERWERSSSA